MTADNAVGELPFEGIRVVELAQWVFVPVAGALLADWGADVIHIEPPSGDPYRGLVTQGIGAAKGGVNLSMALANRGKRSLSIDVRHPDGGEVLAKVLDSADVLLTSLRPKALDRLGLGADAVQERYPRLIFGRGHGYGVRGDDANRAGYDASAFWARGGLAHILTPTDRPQPIAQRGAMGDRNAAMALAFGVASALLNRQRTGKGCVVDVSLLATAMWTLSSDVLAALGGDTPTAASGRLQSSNPLAGTYRTKDSRHIQLVFLEADRYWGDLCRVMGRDDLAADPRFADIHVRALNSAACVELLDEEFAKRTYSEWKALLSGLDAPWAPVQSVPELIDDPQVVSNDYLSDVTADDVTYQLPNGPVQLGGRPPELRRAPEHSEHTEAVLLELGYDWDEITSLRNAGVLG